MSVANVIQLRQLLAERFPAARARWAETPARNSWPTGVTPLDEALGGGLPGGELTEIVAAQKISGSASVIRALLNQAGEQARLIAHVDGSDMLDVTQLSETSLARLLWVRCRDTDQAMKAADLILRDNNLSLVLLDLVGNPAWELRKIPPSAWYRFQRLLEASATMCVAFTPWPMVSPAARRVALAAHFSPASLDADSAQVIGQVRASLSEERRGGLRQSFA